MKFMFVLLTLAMSTAAIANEPSLSYDRKMVKRKIKSNIALFKECYTTEYKKDPTLEGKISVQFEIVGDGTVSKTSIKKSTIKNASLEECLMTTMKTLKFQEIPDGQVAVVVYPFQFKVNK